MRTQGKAYRKGSGIEGDFDVIVVGSGMGGMGVASALAKNGRKVLLLEQHNVVGGLAQSFERNGYRWSVGMHYIGDVASPHTMTRKIFDYATNDAIEWAHLPSIFNRMDIGGRQYAIPAGIDAYREALAGWFPDERGAIDRYLELVSEVTRSSPAYFALKAYPEGQRPAQLQEAALPFFRLARRITRDVIGQLTSNAELTAILCANWGDYGIEPSRSSFAMHAMLFKHYVNGASYPIGGGGAFADAMVPIIESAGGLVLHSATVEQILIEGGRVVGVRLGDGSTVTCKTVISNAGMHATFGRLVDRQVAQSYGLVEKLEQVRPTGTVVGIHVGLEGSAGELGLEPANVWSHPGTDFTANLAAHKSDFSAPFPFCFVTFGSAKDPTWDEQFPGRSTIELHAFTDYSHFKRWENTRWMKRGAEYDALKEQIMERLLAELYRLVPQVKGKVRHVETHTPVSYGTFLRRERGEILGIESSPSRYAQEWLGAWTPVPGLFLTGQDVTNDGMIGALFGGIIAASAVLGKDLVSEIRSREQAVPALTTGE
ncbi:phytoene desaturase family protein [Novosphingobium olei]|uniref:NAD(P)/FAD-dependent oxidoreductase n=1 Tax=Novosphingobium olei TaxID=2728851 RepID=A0A7Y0G989_9SPHN|nr:NAD(P)/FAD-dependent oxidoreductase [Novosphingobium olei]NML93951.1 NAD(P)/FAD-dependent oxidoreductase [Novosphingobium olei]